MPGLVGVIGRLPREQSEQQLSKLVRSIQHENFYTTGTYTEESLGLYVGWTTHAPSTEPQLPIRDDQRGVSLLFSGSEYSDGAAHPESGAHLIRRYAEERNFPAGLNGMFHGLVADRQRGRVLIFIDRFGMHRLYYHDAGDVFYFATEAKAILSVRPELCTPDPQGLGEFIALSCVLENRTIFKNIGVIPAGSLWTFEGKSLRRKDRYFAPAEWEDQQASDGEAHYSELRESIVRNLPRYFRGQSRVGVALTGGLDTRVIMAWHKASPHSLPCYTFGGMYRDCQDVRIARRIAEACQQTHQVITVGDDFLAHFPEYAERTIYLTEGTVDVYRASDLYVSQKARQIAPIKVVGTYGSEIVRHAVMFKPMTPRPGVFNSDVLPFVHCAVDTYKEVRRAHPVTFAAFRQSPWYHHGILALERSQLTVRSPFLDNDFVRATYGAPKQGPLDYDVRLRLITDGDAQLGKIPSDRGVRAGAPGSVRLARGLHEFTFKAEYAYDYGMPQWVSRVDDLFSAMRFERLFLGRHKLLHYRIWYKRALSGYAREMLLDTRSLTRPYVTRKGVEQVVQGHTEKGLNYTSDIHKLLTLELIHRLFFDPCSLSPQ